MNDEDKTKDCGCSIRVVRCEHFANGSKLVLLDLDSLHDKLHEAFPDIEWPRFCIQYESAEYGPNCIGGDTDDQVLAEELFAEYADDLLVRPESGEMLGALVIEVPVEGGRRR